MNEDLLEAMFLNKHLCDAVREATVRGLLSIEEAYSCLSASKDLDRDTHISIKLSCCGFDANLIHKVLAAINT